MAKNILVIKYPYKYQIIINVFVFVSLILYTYIVADPISNYLGFAEKVAFKIHNVDNQ